MTSKKKQPVRENNARTKVVQVNDTLTHPIANTVSDNQRSRWKYSFLRVTREPTIDRPDSGRILVRNLATGNITEHYSILFGVGFKVI